MEGKTIPLKKERKQKAQRCMQRAASLTLENKARKYKDFSRFCNVIKETFLEKHSTPGDF